MKLFNHSLEKITKLAIVFSLAGMISACGSIADAGLDQAQADNPTTIETPEPQQTTNEEDVQFQMGDKPK